MGGKGRGWGKKGESGRVRARYRVKKVLDVLFWIDRYLRDGMVRYTFFLIDFLPGNYIPERKLVSLSLSPSLPPLSLSGMGIRGLNTLTIIPT